jgi:hypothetical protein
MCILLVSKSWQNVDVKSYYQQVYAAKIWPDTAAGSVAKHTQFYGIIHK